MLWLLFFAFLAGFVDSIVGGGGLIQVPALFVFLPPAVTANVAPVWGTNKLAAVCGTSMAAWQYVRKVRLNFGILLPTALAAFVFSFLGARTVSLLDPKVIKPVILVLLILVAVYTAARNKNAPARHLNLPKAWQLPAALAVGSAIGFYDGFFGPGTGTFLIIAFVGLFGFDFLLASASAKVVNFSTNVAAILWFARTGNIYFRYAIPLALANGAGAALGSRMAILKGSEFVRRFFIAVVLILIARFAYELASGR
ncbi:MAG TPA: TSUP family transporter [Verrucomicrobiae bacterium]|jgi:hypothetical protein|nr:TSUP family transporter [Verrucomicrobiae bacterium]